MVKSDFENEFWTVTTGDLEQKRSPLRTPVKIEIPEVGVDKITVDPSVRYQKWVGVGAALTDSSAKLIWDQNNGRLCYTNYFHRMRELTLLYGSRLGRVILLARIIILTMTFPMVSMIMTSAIFQLVKVSQERKTPLRT